MVAVSPNDGEKYADALSALYTNVEFRLLELIVRYLDQGLDSDLPNTEWGRIRNQERVDLQAQVQRLLAEVNPEVARTVAATIQEAFIAGGLAAEVSTFAGQDLPPAAVRGIESIASELSGTLRDVNESILRVTDDVYRRVVAQASSEAVLNVVSRRDATQTALNRLVGTGLKGFQDQSGRNWHLADYVKMATRTATARANVDGHTVALNEAGIDLVMINPGPRACETCDKWAGRVLSTSGGPTGTILMDDVLTGRPKRVYVYGTVEDARRAGWGHPNCRCSLNGYFPGATKVKPRPDWNEKGYEAQQRQRAIEKHIREWKMKQAIALDDATSRKAGAKIREWQAAQRAHINDHPYLKRQYQNEQAARVGGVVVQPG